MDQRWSVEDTLDVELLGVEEVSIRLVGGDVVVAATDGPARLEIKGASGGPVVATIADGTLTVTHEGDGSRRGLLRKLSGASAACSVTLAVPARTRASITSVSADVLVAGLCEPTTIKTVSGDMTLKDLRERTEARTVSGDIEAFGLAGDLNIATVSGDIAIVNGSCRWLQAKTVSGDFTLDLMPPHGSNYSIGTISGDVSIRFPNDPSVTIDASSMSGDMRVDFESERVTPLLGTRKFHGVYGAGDSQLTVKTISGDLRIVRKEVAA